MPCSHRLRRVTRLAMLVAICLAVGVSGSLAPVVSAAPKKKAPKGKYEPGTIAVRLTPTAHATIAGINAAYGTTTVRTVNRGRRIYLVRASQAKDVVTLARRMAADSRLVYAEPNFILSVPEAQPNDIDAWGSDDPAPYGRQDAIDMLQLPQAHAISTGAGSVVAVLDTGVELAHPELAASFTSAGFDFVDNDFTPEDESDGHKSGHGTHVAGIVHLVAPDARLMPLRVLDPDGRGDASTIASAIAFAVEHGANVINLSLGTAEPSELLADAIKQATQAGVVVVAAAGNQDSSAELYPAADACAIAVTAVGPTDMKSSFANFGPWVDVAAPGESIYSTFPVDGYAWWRGTSMATPFVAGQAALIRSMAPLATPVDVAALIGETARSLDELNPGYTGFLGVGRIDVAASLAALHGDRLDPFNQGMISSDCFVSADFPPPDLTATNVLN